MSIKAELEIKKLPSSLPQSLPPSFPRMQSNLDYTATYALRRGAFPFDRQGDTHSAGDRYEFVADPVS